MHGLAAASSTLGGRTGQELWGVSSKHMLLPCCSDGQEVLGGPQLLAHNPPQLVLSQKVPSFPLTNASASLIPFWHLPNCVRINE